MSCAERGGRSDQQAGGRRDAMLQHDAWLDAMASSPPGWDWPLSGLWFHSAPSDGHCKVTFTGSAGTIPAGACAPRCVAARALAAPRVPSFARRIGLCGARPSTWRPLRSDVRWSGIVDNKSGKEPARPPGAAAQEDAAAPEQPVGDAGGRNFRAPRPRRCDGGGRRGARGDRGRARPRSRPRLPAAARALDRRHRHRARARPLRAHAARTPAWLALARQHPHHRDLSQRLLRRHVDASRRRAGRRANRFRGAQGPAVLRLARRASGRGQALQSHDARGARAGDAGDRRRLRLLARSSTSSTSAAATARCSPRSSPPIRIGARRCSIWRKRSPPPSAARAGRCPA